MSFLRTMSVGLLFLTGLSIIERPGTAHAVPFRNRDYLPTTQSIDWSTTRVRFELDGKSWDYVLKWFADGLQVASLSKLRLLAVFVSRRDVSVLSVRGAGQANWTA